MNKALVGVLALAVLVIGGLTGYRFYQNKQAEAAYKAAVFEFAKADFLVFMEQMNAAVGEKGADQLKKLADGFPKHDAGIGYDERFDVRVYDEYGKSITYYTPSVGYVYLNSGAHKAGILPGERFVAINGTTTEIRCGKDDVACPDQAAVDRVKQLVDLMDQGRTRVSLGSGGHVWLVPVPYGQDIHDHILANLDGYRKQLDAIAPKVTALEGKVKAAADMKTVQSLVPEANALGQEISGVYQGVEAYIKTRVILPPQPTKAEPQL